MLIHTVRYLASGQPSPDPGDFQLRLLDPRDLRDLWRWDTSPGDTWGGTLSPDTRFVYLMRPNADHFSRRDGADVSFGNGPAFGVFDLATRQLVAERALPNGGSLMPLWQR